MNVAEVAHERKTGIQIPEHGYEEVPILIGEKLLPEDEIPAKFPRTMAKIAECTDEDLAGL